MPSIANWTAGLFVPHRRSIGGFPAQVTIRETERDELQITEHPVEQGAPIADHAFKKPTEIQIRAGWSRGNLSATGNGVYNILLSLQAALMPFDVYTGKRAYKDMLLQSLTVTTDEHSNYVLMADMVLREVIIVKTKTGEQKGLSSNPDNQKRPESNGTSTDKGDQKTRELTAKAEAGDTSEFDYGSDTAALDVQRAEMGDTSEFQYGEGQTPEASKVNDAAAKNTAEQQNVEKSISLDRPERQQSQATKDILADRDKQRSLPKVFRTPLVNITSLRSPQQARIAQRRVHF